MSSLSSITGVFLHCMDEPGFFPSLFERLGNSAPEFAQMMEDTPLEARAFMARKCVTNSLLYASGGFSEEAIVEKFQRCGITRVMTPTLYPVWVTCLVDTIGMFERMTPGVRAELTRVLTGCAKHLFRPAA